MFFKTVPSRLISVFRKHVQNAVQSVAGHYTVCCYLHGSKYILQDYTKLTITSNSWKGRQIALANNTERISRQRRIKLEEGIDMI